MRALWPSLGMARSGANTGYEQAFARLCAIWKCKRPGIWPGLLFMLSRLVGHRGGRCVLGLQSGLTLQLLLI